MWHVPRQSDLDVPAGLLRKVHCLHKLLTAAIRIFIYDHLCSCQVARGLHDGAVAEDAAGLRERDRVDQGTFVSVLPSHAMMQLSRVDDGL